VNANATIRIRIEADEFTKSVLPDEVNYQAGEIVVTQARGMRAISRKLYTSNVINLGNVRTMKGDRLIIEINEIKRINSIGEMIIIKPKNRRVIMIPVSS
jgi:hypothetical protein